MSKYHSELFKEINRLASQKILLTPIGLFRKAISKRLRAIHLFQVAMNKASHLFVRLSKRYITLYKPTVLIIDSNNYFVNKVDDFQFTFDSLLEESSRGKFITYIAYNYIKSYGSRLPFDYDYFNGEVAKLELIANKVVDGFIAENSFSKTIYIPFEPLGHVINYKLEQYAFEDWLRVEKGDVVLDCGGANGDTALYFAANGAEKVYSFEFLKSNIKKFITVLDKNSQCKGQVSIVEKALWDRSGIKLSFEDNGNASTVSEAKITEDNFVETISIDDFLLQQISRVDFIKMDIEGAELSALKGAKESIIKYKPKLAICVYHKDCDLVEIPKFILSLGCGYKLNFDYYTDTGAEAVLYAKVVD
ncbi:FkbM family methyltransferase [Pseudoalteromonas sp. SWXJZ10B]|uniref:FkbM family methyltransferase n=1 Tax=Pseudoalteromonas sp. SWXJZ10B TaxID=2792063 RepID=UPI0018CFCE43|nr:FkbM family methyltransferase [Pseudoalteromonas sp. SWXJZ10B]MBH0042951.1 FkbM family methyltransferase [Pseudoalteromonas sp. SWXJZ10B]